MPLTEARSLARYAAVNRTQRARVWDWLEHEPAQDLQQLKQLAADCDRFSPRVGYGSTIDASGKPAADCLWLDASSHHRLSPAVAAAREQQLLQDVAAMFSHRGHYISTALADSLSAAWGLAHFGQQFEAGENLGLPQRDAKGAGEDSGRNSAKDSAGNFGNESFKADFYLPVATGLAAVRSLCGPSFFVPSGQTLAALSPLPIEALRLDDKVAETLRCLGIETVEQLWELPRSELPARFGPSLLERMDQATGDLAETFEAYRTTEPLSVQLDLERPTDRRELLVECLRELLGELIGLMKDQNRAALRVACSLTTEGDSVGSGKERVYDSNAPANSASPADSASATHALTIGLFEPSRDPERLLHLLAMQLERRVIPKPVCRMELTVTVSVRPEQGRVQWLPGMEDAAGESTVRKTMKREMSGLVEHLSCRLGDQSVLAAKLTAEPQIERAYQLLQLTGGGSLGQMEQRSATSTQAAIRRHVRTASTRPLQVFAPAVRLHCQPHSQRQYQAKRQQSWEQVPTTIRFEEHTYQIVEHWGPERIETNWWHGKLLRRDYYRLEDQHGHHWWAFYDLREQDWFLQGSFE